MRYFITFACYGGQLHGDALGSVDRRRNLARSRLLEADPPRTAAERQRMKQAPYLLDPESRVAVLEALRQVSARTAAGVCWPRMCGLLTANIWDDPGRAATVRKR